MRIQINGEPREFQQRSLSLEALLDTLSLPPQRIAVELNKTMVPRSQWEKTPLKDGDQIEIVHFVGGGASNEGASAPLSGTLLSSLALLEFEIGFYNVASPFD